MQNIENCAWHVIHPNSVSAIVNIMNEEVELREVETVLKPYPPNPNSQTHCLPGISQSLGSFQNAVSFRLA